MSELKRRSFFRAAMGGTFTAPLAIPATRNPKKTVSRLLILADPRFVPTETLMAPGLWDGMDIYGPIIFVDLPYDKGPIQLLNIDDIPAETLESLIHKIKDLIE